MQRALIAAEEARAGMYTHGTEVTNAAAPSDLGQALDAMGGSSSPPPRGSAL